MFILKETNNKIRKFEWLSENLIINHANGYHGSSKGICVYCQNDDDESAECTEATKSKRKSYKKCVKQLKDLQLILKKMKSSERNKIEQVLDFNYNFENA